MNKLINRYPNPNSVLFFVSASVFVFPLPRFHRTIRIICNIYGVILYPDASKNREKFKTTKAESNVCVYIHHLIRSVTKNSQVEPLHGDDD